MSQQETTHHTLDRKGLEGLFTALQERGYTVVGPTVRDGAVVLDQLRSVDELPAGWSDEQEPGGYRLKRGGQRGASKNGDGALFDHTAGPHAWKRFLHPPRLRLWRAERGGGALRVLPETREEPRYAFLGVRGCDLAAIAVQDRVFLDGEHVDPVYRQRRRDAFLVAVHCGRAGGTCFCASMDTGPRAGPGFDLALTEVLDGDRHYFVVETGSERGAELLAELGPAAATGDEVAAAERRVAQAAEQMGRSLEVEGLPELLQQNAESPHWNEVAARCLACGNCTLVCPTCFCTTVEDATDLTGRHAERWRSWDSCFNADFSYIHGGSVRTSTRSRYRQWMTHKLSTWIDQFGTSGCVGCGRCITWCPVGIDITEEARKLRGRSAHDEVT